jgi:hypothetical protein
VYPNRSSPSPTNGVKGKWQGKATTEGLDALMQDSGYDLEEIRKKNKALQEQLTGRSRNKTASHIQNCSFNLIRFPPPHPSTISLLRIRPNDWSAVLDPTQQGVAQQELMMSDASFVRVQYTHTHTHTRAYAHRRLNTASCLVEIYTPHKCHTTHTINTTRQPSSSFLISLSPLRPPITWSTSARPRP